MFGQCPYISAGVIRPCCHLLRVSFFMFEFSQELIVHLCKLTATFTWFSACLDRQRLRVEEVILQNQPALLEPWRPPMAFFQADPSDPSMVKFCSPEAQSCDPAFCLIPSLQHPELHHLMITVARAAPNIHIPDWFFLVYISTRPSRTPLISSLITCITKLSSMHSGNFLYCSCPPVLPSTDSRWLRSLIRTRAWEREASSSCLKKVSSTSCPWSGSS